MPHASVPYVVMVVANDVRSDTRVRKSALAVAALGLRVTVVGVTTAPRRWDTALDVPEGSGEVRIVRVPVDFVLSQNRKDRRARRHRGEFSLLTPDPAEEALTRRRLAAAEIDARSATGPVAPLRRAAVDARRFLLRAEGAGRRKAAQGAKLGYKVVDKGWQKVTLAAAPQRVVPEVDDLELAVGPVLDALEPDVVHAHDVHLLGVVSRAVARARVAGRDVRWLYDAHEWVPGLSRYGGRTARVIAAWAALERRFIGTADAVITVSPPLADALRDRYHLRATPDVVLNVPPLGARAAGARSVRAAAEVADGVSLLVYSGGVQAARGVETAVEALTHLPDAHLAVVAVPSVHTAPVAAVRARAEALGVADRLHVLPPVPPDQVSAFLSGADIGLIPLKHYASHEMALANKLFEYLHAGVPMVVSDCRAQAGFVTEHGVGEVHRAGDGADLAAAVTRVLADRPRYATALADPELLARYTWHTQADVLRGVHRRLLATVRSDAVLAADPATDAVAEPAERLVAGRLPDGVEPAGDLGPAAGSAPAATEPAAEPVLLAIGPANSAGQGWAWARAAERHLPGVRGHVVAIRNGRYDYPADELVDAAAYRSDAAWQLRELADARSRWTHALLEAGRPIFGGLAGRDFTGDAQLLRAGGVEVGLVLHGSETRDPRRHRGQHEFSPFADPRDALTKKLQAKVDLLLPRVTEFAAAGGPVFVSTPDQLDDVPRATWLPVVVDVDTWQRDERQSDGGRVATLTRDVPLFVHAPTHPQLKGTAEVEAVLRPLADRGVLEFRLVTGLPPTEAAALIASADVVVDQLLLGLYGVLACEAMAGGTLVLGHVGDALRHRVDRDVPVVEVTPRTLAEVVERVLDDRGWAREQAARGPGFVRAVHDGRRSAAVLAPFLGRTADAGAARPGSGSTEPAEVTAR
jgi:glycosyltransferase involved in cell wall biosynthesis